MPNELPRNILCIMSFFKKTFFFQKSALLYQTEVVLVCLWRKMSGCIGRLASDDRMQFKIVSSNRNQRTQTFFFVCYAVEVKYFCLVYLYILELSWKFTVHIFIFQNNVFHKFWTKENTLEIWTHSFWHMYAHNRMKLWLGKYMPCQC